MSIRAASQQEIAGITARALRLFNRHHRMTRQRVIATFQAIHTAQCAAMYMAYGSVQEAADAGFWNDIAAAQAGPVIPEDLRALYIDLRNMLGNTHDRQGGQWLPESYRDTAEAMLTSLAERAAGWRDRLYY